MTRWHLVSREHDVFCLRYFLRTGHFLKKQLPRRLANGFMVCPGLTTPSTDEGNLSSPDCQTSSFKQRGVVFFFFCCRRWRTSRPTTWTALKSAFRCGWYFFFEKQLPRHQHGWCNPSASWFIYFFLMTLETVVWTSQICNFYSLNFFWEYSNQSANHAMAKVTAITFFLYFCPILMFLREHWL